MPSSTARTFTDPDVYAASIHRTNAKITTLGRGRFEAKLVQVDLGRLRMQRFFDNLPRVAYAADTGGHATISFRTRPGPDLVRSGVELLSTNVIRRGNVESYFQKSDGLAAFGEMSMSIEDLVAFGAAIVGSDLAPPKDGISVTPATGVLRQLLQLHEAAGYLAEHAPSVLTQPGAARGLEQALIEAMAACLGAGEIGEDKSALRQHSAIMRRFHRVVEENPNQALFMPELCKEVGASERTLRICCQEQLGVSPKRYLLLHRMQLVRQALHASTRGATSVTEIATRYGFWQFGRFAAEYKALFGEFPSAALARSPR